MKPPFFRSRDHGSHIAHYYFRPDELIGFANLLLRWQDKSFFKVPFFTILRKVGDTWGFYLPLLEAKGIAFTDEPSDEIPVDPLPAIHLNGNPQQAVVEREAEPVTPSRQEKSAGENHADGMRIFTRLQLPFTVRSRYEHLHEHFDKLYFRYSDVEAIERVYPECRIVSPRFQGRCPDSKYHSLYLTTEENIAEVGGLALYYMASCLAAPEEHHSTFRDGLVVVDCDIGWFGDECAKDSFPIPFFPEIRKENIWPNVRVAAPPKVKRSRTMDLEEIKPILGKLKGMGILEKNKLAKIIESLYPQLSDNALGALIYGSPDDKKNSEANRDRGRRLRGLK